MLLISSLPAISQQVIPVQPIAPRYDFTVQQPRPEPSSEAEQPFRGAQPSRIFRPERNLNFLREAGFYKPFFPLQARRNDTYEEKIFMMVSEVYMADPSDRTGRY